MKMKRFLLPAALLLGAFLARLYLPELGLPNSQVNRIYQDRTDYIWICTEGGLVRFDGLRFETYQHDRESANCLSSSSVIDMVEDGRGTKWIGTAAGLDILDSEYSSFTHFDLHRTPDTPVNPYIGRLLEVPAAGTLIVGTGGAGGPCTRITSIPCSWTLPDGCGSSRATASPSSWTPSPWNPRKGLRGARNC